MNNPIPNTKQRWQGPPRKVSASLSGTAVVVALLIVVGVSHTLFRGYFPGPHGLGHDYSFFLPDLLSNYYWARAEGPWFPPWFTPAFCGGQPAFPDPQSIYYSLPQALVTFLDPVTSVYVTLLVLVALGFVGTYFFLRLSLTTSVTAAIVGATLFALNGFFSHRMLVGHLAFHGIMLVPLLALALTVPDNTRRVRGANALLWGTGGALVLGYWVVGGMAVLIIPAILAVITLILVHGLVGGSLRAVPARATVAVLLGMGLAASKIAGALAYMHQFPRSAYPLRGMSDSWATLEFAATALFFSPENIAALEPGTIAASQHEFEFSMTPVPAILMTFGFAIWLLRKLRQSNRPGEINWKVIGLAAALVVVLFVPIALNTSYGPGWDAILNSLPVIKSSSTLIRWFLVFIPPIAAGTALAVDSLSHSGKLRAILAIAACTAAIAIHAQADRKYYASQFYDPGLVVAAFARARASDFVPSIQNIGMHVDKDGRAVFAANGNDVLTQNASQMFCYNPIFGYRLESFPRKSLRPGPALGEREGYLNLKNPACYLFPAENGCTPGAHFAVGQRAEAQRFLHYQSFPYSRSTFQQLADILNILAVLGVPVLIIWGLSWRRRALRRVRDDLFQDGR